MRTRSRWSAAALSVMLALSALGATPVSAQDDGFTFKPLRMPFPAGEGVVMSGYDNPENEYHQGVNRYSLDFCAGADCKVGVVGTDVVLAPTDLTYVESYDYNGPADGRDDYHFFEVATSSERKLCMALGHFDPQPVPLHAWDPGGPSTYAQGTTLGTLLSYGSAPHVHIGLWTVAKDARCDVSVDTGNERTPVAFVGRYALDMHDGKPQEFPASETHAMQLGDAVTSTNSAASGPGPTTDPGKPIPVAQWIAPAEGAQVGPRPTLAARPTLMLVDGSLVDDSTTARIDFHVLVDGTEVPACSADRADDAARWTCEADLLGLGATEGDVQLTFHLVRTDGSVVSAPDGVRTVVYAAPLTAAWKAPAKGARLETSNLRLAAKASDGSTEADIDKVVFRAQWGKKKPKRACVATKAGKKGVWSCKVDLWKIGAQLGKLKLSFDVVDLEGSVTRSPDGTRNVRFASKPVAPKNVRVVTDIDAALSKCDSVPCRFPYQVRWGDVNGETGYRIYVKHLWYALPGPGCFIETGKTKRFPPKKVPANSTVFNGEFEGPEPTRDYVIYGSQYFVEAYNDAGRSPMVATKPQVYLYDANCNEVRAP